MASAKIAGNSERPDRVELRNSGAQHSQRLQQFKWKEWNVPRNSKQNDGETENANRSCWQKQPRKIAPANFEAKIGSDSVSEKRGQQDRQGIQGQSSEKIPLEKLMDSPQ